MSGSNFHFLSIAALILVQMSPRSDETGTARYKKDIRGSAKLMLTVMKIKRIGCSFGPRGRGCNGQDKIGASEK